ncbi:MAG: hypothetical protein ABSF31_14025, partial [Steroidobacteraceae bacterium]
MQSQCLRQLELQAFDPDAAFGPLRGWRIAPQDGVIQIADDVSLFIQDVGEAPVIALYPLAASPPILHLDGLPSPAHGQAAEFQLAIEIDRAIGERIQSCREERSFLTQGVDRDLAKQVKQAAVGKTTSSDFREIGVRPDSCDGFRAESIEWRFLLAILFIEEVGC